MSGTPPRPIVYDPPVEPLKILHQDDHILVLDKPSGLLCVPGKPAAHRDCLATRAKTVCPNARIVHRLDMDTSGVIVLACSQATQRHIGLQFERRKTHKIYIARVWRSVAADSGHIDWPLRCDWPNRPKQMVDFELGRPSQTSWHVLNRELNATRVRLIPLTGRSHQLRVHMMNLGHPVLGDNLYAPEEARLAASRLQLHAQEITLHHPAGGRRLTFMAPTPF